EIAALGRLGEAELRGVVTDPGAGLLLLGLRRLQLLQRDEVLADQKLAETSSHALHPSLLRGSSIGARSLAKRESGRTPWGIFGSEVRRNATRPAAGGPV